MIGEILSHYRGSLQTLIILGLSLWAFTRCAQPEKATAGILLAMLAAFSFVPPVEQGERYYADIVPGYFVLDLFVFFALIPLAMRANRLYPLWLLAAQMICVINHFQRALLPSIEPLAYFVLHHGPSWVQVAALAIGMVAHRRRFSRYGDYRSWRQSTAS